MYLIASFERSEVIVYIILSITAPPPPIIWNSGLIQTRRKVNRCRYQQTAAVHT